MSAELTLLASLADPARLQPAYDVTFASITPDMAIRAMCGHHVSA